MRFSTFNQPLARFGFLNQSKAFLKAFGFLSRSVLSCDPQKLAMYNKFAENC